MQSKIREAAKFISRYTARVFLPSDLRVVSG